MTDNKRPWIRYPATDAWLTRKDHRWRIGTEPSGQWQIQQHVDGPNETWGWKATVATQDAAILWIHGYERGVQDMGHEIISVIEDWIEEA